MKSMSFTLLFILFYNYCFGQSPLPTVSSYDRFDYNAGRQNWDIIEDERGIFYFANNEGLLVHTFGTWKVYPTTHKDQIISLQIQNDTLWTGGNVEFGYYARNQQKELEYTNCGAINSGQAWEIELDNQYAFFRTEKNIIRFDKGSGDQTVISHPSSFSRLKKWNNEIYAIDKRNRIGKIKDDLFVVLDSLTTNSKAKHLISHNNELYIFTEDGAFFSFNGGILQSKGKLPQLLNREGIFCIESYSKESLLIGSISGGLYIFSISENNILEKVNVSDGLLDNTILSVFIDKNKNIWCALDYGISKIERKQPLQTIFNQGATYSILNLENGILIGTNKGLFYADHGSKFHLIPNSQGQVWNIKEIENTVYICHDNGVFIYNDHTITSIYKQTGVLDIEKITSHFILSTYLNVVQTKLEKKHLKTEKIITNHSIKKLFKDDANNCLWGFNNGELLEKFVLSGKEIILDETYEDIHNVFRDDKSMLFLKNGKLYTYLNKAFIKQTTPPYSLIEGEHIKALAFSSNKHSYAYIEDDQLFLYVNVANGKFIEYQNQLSSLQNQFLRGHEFISFNKEVLQIANERGVHIFEPHSKYRTNSLPKPIITNVVLHRENVTDEFNYPYQNSLSIKNNFNAITFHFGINSSKNDIIQYRTKLYPLENNFSDWTSSSSKEFNGLKGGDYTFFIESKFNNSITQADSLTFSIHKKWYETPFLFFLVGLVLISFAFIIQVIWKKQLYKNELKQKEIQTALFNQKNIALKNQQLVEVAEELSKKNDFLRQVSDGLSLMKNKNAEHWKSKIEKEMNNDSKHFVFYNLFTELNKDFMERLNLSHPNLTSHDHRLIALIRFNLTNQEIANILNITNRSVIMNRYRLRKKLSLDKEIELDKYLREI